MVRIRYSKKDGYLVSPDLVAGKSLCVGSVDLSTFQYNIVAIDKGTVLATGAATTLAGAKKGLKEALQAAGVVFDSEVRNARDIPEEEQGGGTDSLTSHSDDAPLDEEEAS